LHGLECSACRRGDHRSPGRLCLDRRDPELLDVGQDQCFRMGVQVDQFLVVDAAEKLDLAGILRAQPLELGSTADYLETPARFAGRLRGDVDALVRDEFGDRQEVIVGLTGAKALDLDRGVHDCRVAPV
jgi:hypothetical protein